MQSSRALVIAEQPQKLDDVPKECQDLEELIAA